MSSPQTSTPRPPPSSSPQRFSTPCSLLSHPPARALARGNPKKDTVTRFRSNERTNDRANDTLPPTPRTHALGLHHTAVAFPSSPLPRPRPRPPSYPVNPLAKMTHDATAASTVNPFRLPGVIRCHPSTSTSTPTEPRRSDTIRHGRRLTSIHSRACHEFSWRCHDFMAHRIEVKNSL
jgi:hypothetical protein